MRSSDAPVELVLDLRATPPDKILPRLFGALDRVSADVTLLVSLRDTPEYAGVTANVHAALQQRNYVSDMSRVPGGGQRLRVQRRREQPRWAARTEIEARDPAYTPPPAPVLSSAEPAADLDANVALDLLPSANGQRARATSATTDVTATRQPSD